MLLERVASIKRIRKGKRSVAFVANRVRARTRNTAALERFLDAQRFPTLARLRDSQLYSNAADAGLSIFETRESRAAGYRAEWDALTAALEDAAG